MTERSGDDDGDSGASAASDRLTIAGNRPKLDGRLVGFARSFLTASYRAGARIFLNRIAPPAVYRQDFMDRFVERRMSNAIRRPDDGDSGVGVATRTRPRTKRPSLYRVLLLNDDYTPMEFVVHVLERFFQKGREEATRIMLHVHQHGVGECGTYTYEVAETKVTQVMDFARKHQHPLQCVMEKK
jgi:ATP-dependent Clp protease adaptor protein ClpS